MMDPRIPDEPPLPNQLQEEASLWFAWMRGPDAEAHRLEFERWLARGAAHLGAYNRAAEIFSFGKFLAEPEERGAVAAPAERRPRSRRIAMFAGAALILLLGLWIAGAKPEMLVTAGSPALRVASESTRSPTTTLMADDALGQDFHLEDGSVARLEAGARLEVAFSDHERALHLLSGRGRFDVAHAARPFVVYAGGGSVTAHGTVFDVGIDSRRRVTVKLLRGAIDVRLPVAAPPVQRLQPGQEIAFAGIDREAAGPGPGAAPSARPALATGAIRDFDEERLSVLVAEANRQPGPRLRLTDATLGDLRISGRFGVADPVKLAERVAALKGLRIDRSKPDEIVLGRP